jgi:hypothetical protein
VAGTRPAAAKYDLSRALPKVVSTALPNVRTPLLPAA